MAYKLKIEKAFTDKETGKAHKVGDTITVNDARGKELLADPRELVSSVNKVVEAKGVDKPQKVKADEIKDLEITSFNDDGTANAIIDGEEVAIKPANKEAAEVLAELKAATDGDEPAGDETTDNK